MNQENAEPSDSRMFELLQKEKEQKSTEMFDYNKRLDRTILLYITATYAALGANLAGQLDLSSARTDDSYVWIVFLFVFLNVCVLFHALSQSFWCMALAKFIHMKLDPDLQKLAGRPVDESKPHPGGTFDSVGSFGWDDWTKWDFKGLANQSRDAVTGLWCGLVLLVSIVSFSFVNLHLFLYRYPQAGIIVLTLLALYFFAIRLFVWVFVLVRSFHGAREEHSKSDQRIIKHASAIVRIVPPILTVAFGVLCFLASYWSTPDSPSQKNTNAAAELARLQSGNAVTATTEPEGAMMHHINVVKTRTP